MALTNIGAQKTPGRPVEITFAAELGEPTQQKTVVLIGHAASGFAASGLYTTITIENGASLPAASGEAITKFGAGSELALMVIAAVRANQGQSTFPPIIAVPLASTDTDFGASDAALTAVARIKADLIVSPYDGNGQVLTQKVIATAQGISGAQNVQNNQFGSFAWVFSRSAATAAALFAYDTQFVQAQTLRDTGTGANAPAYSIGEMAAASAAIYAANGIPFNPLNRKVINGVAAPAIQSNWYTIGAGLESEAILAKGWSPWQVLPNGTVCFVRTVTGRLTSDGTTPVTAYYDAQDFDVLYFWRQTVFTRLSQPDFSNVKASLAVAQDIKGELIRLAQLFEDQNMFQAVSQLAASFVVERSASDRHRFDVLTPVNVIPGLQVIATNIQATTEFDVLTV